MTALKEYMRLETSGLWRPSPDAQRREVGVSFGDATLVISDGAGRPLTHWSLPAVTRTNTGNIPAIYCPDSDATETLEIDDDLMINAIERVRQSVARKTPRPGWVRQISIGLTLLVCLGLSVFWLPGALTQQTLKVVPASKRTEIGATLLGHIQRIAGSTCRDPVGTQALAVLETRLFGNGSNSQIVVVPGDLPEALDLPGGIVVISRRMVEDATDPAVVAGYILAAIAGQSDPDPLAPILNGAGFGSTFHLLTTGNLPDEELQAYAEGLLTTPAHIPPAETLFALSTKAQVPVAPWAYAVDPTGETLRTLIESDPLKGNEAVPFLTDDNWVSLQGICRT
jgi:hypothetical protein